VQIFVPVVLIFNEEIKAVNVNNRLRASNQNKVNEKKSDIFVFSSKIERVCLHTLQRKHNKGLK